MQCNPALNKDVGGTTKAILFEAPPWAVAMTCSPRCVLATHASWSTRPRAHLRHKRNNTPSWWGQGNFKLSNASAALDDKALEFKLSNEQDLVCLSGDVTTLGEVLAFQRQQKPDASVNYHSLEQSAENPGKYVLQQTHRIAFLHQDGASDDECCRK